MKWFLAAAGVVLALVVLVYAIGALLPRTHEAAVRARYDVPPDRILQTIRNVGDGTAWRTGLQRVELLSGPGQPVRWRETADWGQLTFARLEDSPRRVVARIEDEGQGFGGTWTWEIEPADGGAAVTITEHGRVDSPLFRFMSRFVFGHYRSLETYAADLARRVEAGDVTVERVAH